MLLLSDKMLNFIKSFDIKLLGSPNARKKLTLDEFLHEFDVDQSSFFWNVQSFNDIKMTDELIEYIGISGDDCEDRQVFLKELLETFEIECLAENPVTISTFDFEKLVKSIMTVKSEELWKLLQLNRIILIKYLEYERWYDDCVCMFNETGPSNNNIQPVTDFTFTPSDDIVDISTQLTSRANILSDSGASEYYCPGYDSPHSSDDDDKVPKNVPIVYTARVRGNSILDGIGSIDDSEYYCPGYDSPHPSDDDDEKVQRNVWSEDPLKMDDSTGFANWN